MTRATTLRTFGALLFGAACGLGQAQALLSDPASIAMGDAAVLKLQLADGTVVRVPSDTIDKRADGQALAERGGTAMRRVVPRPRAPMFDAQRLGAIASVRG